ncbi:hypothetical protein IAD21_02239 [Abditibacteriota bacterium]|nr:hypothetical protein IAD21_02239 [Abditibacteriota bacterium]
MEVVLTYLLCLIPVVLIGGLFIQKWRLRWLVVGIYILVYISRSHMGYYYEGKHYESKPDGDVTWQTHWIPSGLLEPSPQQDTVQLTYLGKFFCVPIGLDSLLWHSTIKTHMSHAVSFK